MRLGLPQVVFLSLSLLRLAPLALSQQVSPRPLITQPIVEGQLTTLKGNTHPLARAQFDIGAAPLDLPMQRMLLVLKRSPEQEFALHKLVDDQQDKASPNYHKWLTPDEFGVQFGPSDQDLQLVTGWLQTHGFQVNRVTHGRTVVEFSGTEAQVEEALHTQIHKYLVNGEEHWANASDPQIPSALVPAVAGVLSLHNFPRKSMSKIIGSYSPKTKQLTQVHPQFTIGYGCYPNGTCYAVGPADFGTIYNVQPLWNSGIDGTGQKIAIVGESDINIQDIRDFRSLFGLPAKDPNIIYDGPNPGLMPDESEADIDVEWSGAIAPNATIDFVVSQSTETTFGVDLSALYIIDNNLAPVMSESYGECELGLGTSGNQFYNALWSQAAAQGITAILSSGDSGSALCDFQGGPAQFGLAVSGFASTPFNVAIGGTDFNDFLHETTYWNSTNTSPTQESAKGYIPETTWNDSCTNSIFLKAFGFGTNSENDCNNQNIGGVDVVGGSGGVSNCTSNNGSSPSSCSGGYPKPSWQVAPGVPADGKRDLPDVSLFASNGILNSFYIFCESDIPANCAFGLYGAAGGTSFGAPAFAGIMALVNQKMQTPEGQGNANYALYKLAGQQSAASCNSSNGSGSSCVFNDITSGTIAMPCLAGSPSCVVKTAGHQYGILSGFATGTGYDAATGLGSLNAANLVNKWSSVIFRPTNTNLSLNPTTSLTHGQSVTVTANVAPSTGTGTPSGNLSLLTSTGVNAGGFTLANGALSSTTNLLPGGSYSVTAHYAGDSTFGGSDSAPINVTVGKENSSPQIELVTFDWQGNLISSNASTAVYGSPYLLRVDVLNSASSACQLNGVPRSGCPTGNVGLTDNGSPLTGGTFALNSLGYTEDQIVQFGGGSNVVKANYAGDNSFNASSATTTYSLTPASTTMAAPSSCCLQVNSSLQANVTLQAQSFGAAPTGTVKFFLNGAQQSGTISYQSTAGSLQNPTATLTAYFSGSLPITTPGNYSVTASYSGDQNYSASTSPATPISVKFTTPAIIPTISPSNTVSAGTTVSLSIAVGFVSTSTAPTGPIMLSDANGTVPIASYSTVTGPNGVQNLQATVAPFVASTSDIYSVQYPGDANYPANSSGNFFLTITGNDFTLSANQSSVSVVQGAQANETLFVGTQSTTGAVNFATTACSGLPNESSCNFTQNPMFNSGQDTLVISTTAPHYLAKHANAMMPITPLTGPFAFPLFGIVFVCSVSRRRRVLLLSFVSAMVLIAILGIGCGGGSTLPPPPPPPLDPGTPKGNYQITVTATSGTGTSTISHTTSFTLVVQ